MTAVSRRRFLTGAGVGLIGATGVAQTPGSTLGSAPRRVVFAMCVGSFMNPIGFIALAIRPTLRQTPISPFGAIMAGSFTLTTIGYAGAGWAVGQAAMRAF